jgi:hypothetical protein
MDMKRVYLDITVCDYDLIGSGDPIGKVFLGWNQQKTYKAGYKHWKEVLENPRRPIIKWHILQVCEEFELRARNAKVAVRGIWSKARELLWARNLKFKANRILKSLWLEVRVE